MTEIRKINGAISIGLLDLEAFSLYRNLVIKREQEKKGTAYLLEKLLGPQPYNLKYTPENKPYLEGAHAHISISHSHDRLAVIVNREQPAGIDIELIRDKVLHIRHKFLNTEESGFAGNDTQKLITIWAAKEAMYKVYGLRGVDFREHLAVQPFAGNELSGSLKKNGTEKKFELISERLGDYIMVYVSNEIR